MLNVKKMFREPGPTRESFFHQQQHPFAGQLPFPGNPQHQFEPNTWQPQPFPAAYQQTSAPPTPARKSSLFFKSFRRNNFKEEDQPSRSPSPSPDKSKLLSRFLLHRKMEGGAPHRPRSISLLQEQDIALAYDPPGDSPMQLSRASSRALGIHDPAVDIEPTRGLSMDGTTDSDIAYERAHYTFHRLSPVPEFAKSLGYRSPDLSPLKGKQAAPEPPYADPEWTQVRKKAEIKFADWVQRGDTASMGTGSTSAEMGHQNAIARAEELSTSAALVGEREKTIKMSRPLPPIPSNVNSTKKTTVEDADDSPQSGIKSKEPDSTAIQSPPSEPDGASTLSRAIDPHQLEAELSSLISSPSTVRSHKSPRKRSSKRERAPSDIEEAEQFVRSQLSRLPEEKGAKFSPRSSDKKTSGGYHPPAAPPFNPISEHTATESKLSFGSLGPPTETMTASRAAETTRYPTTLAHSMKKCENILSLLERVGHPAPVVRKNSPAIPARNFHDDEGGGEDDDPIDPSSFRRVQEWRSRVRSPPASALAYAASVTEQTLTSTDETTSELTSISRSPLHRMAVERDGDSDDEESLDNPPNDTDPTPVVGPGGLLEAFTASPKLKAGTQKHFHKLAPAEASAIFDQIAPLSPILLRNPFMVENAPAKSEETFPPRNVKLTAKEEYVLGLLKQEEHSGMENIEVLLAHFPNEIQKLIDVYPGLLLFASLRAKMNATPTEIESPSPNDTAVSEKKVTSGSPPLGRISPYLANSSVSAKKDLLLEKALDRILEYVESAGELTDLQRSLISLHDKLISATGNKASLDARVGMLEQAVFARSVHSTRPP